MRVDHQEENFSSRMPSSLGVYFGRNKWTQNLSIGLIFLFFIMYDMHAMLGTSKLSPSPLNIPSTKDTTTMGKENALWFVLTFSGLSYRSMLFSGDIIFRSVKSSLMVVGAVDPEAEAEGEDAGAVSIEKTSDGEIKNEAEDADSELSEEDDNSNVKAVSGESSHPGLKSHQGTRPPQQISSSSSNKKRESNRKSSRITTNNPGNTKRHPQSSSSSSSSFSPPAADTTTTLIEFPDSIEYLIINIGCNIDPPMPPRDNTSVAVLAVEPLLHTAARITKRERLYVITCAISDSFSFQTFHLYNIGGLSSSLAPLKEKNVWFRDYVDMDPRKGRKHPEFREGKASQYRPDSQIVPVMPLRTLINAIPERIQILELKTDMQGFDFRAVSSLREKEMGRLSRIVAEVNVDSESAYEGASNDLEKDWKPFMKQHGFRLQDLNGGGGERDAVWVRT